MSEHREALVKIMKICNESSEYNRRTQAIHEEAMQAVGLTESQRQERHVKAMMRSEQFKEDRKTMSGAQCRRAFKESTEADTGEDRISIKHNLVKG